MKAHPSIKVFDQLINIPPDEEQRAYGLLCEKSRAAKQICREILRKFPNLCKFLQRVWDEFGRTTLQNLWCRIWGALSIEKTKGTSRTAAALAHLADPDDRVVGFEHSNREVLDCIEALEKLAYA